MKSLVLTEGAGVPEVSEPMQCLDPFCSVNKIQELWQKGLEISEGSSSEGFLFGLFGFLWGRS